MSLKIDISEIIEHPGGEKAFACQKEIEDTSIGERKVKFIKPVTVEGVVSNVSHGLLVEGKTTTSLLIECSRCLEEYELKVETGIEELFVFNPEKEALENKEVFPINGKTIDLELPVYQSILIEVPFKPLCRPDCAGICPECGRNKNIYPHVCQKDTMDIRMSALKDYFKKSKEG